MSLTRTVWGVLAMTAVLFAVPYAAGQSATQDTQVTRRPSEVAPKWSVLTPAQKASLAPLERDWPSIDADRKRKWLEVAVRVQVMPAAERERMQLRMAEWARLSPAQRGQARLQFQEFQQLAPQDRNARWEAYQALPGAEREALAARGQPPARMASASMPPSGKRNVVGPTAATPPARPVTPTVVQAKPGATTSLVSKPGSPPAHHQPGMPKIAATRGFVDPATLLPKRGPQGAAVIAVAPEAAASAAAHP